MSARRRCTAFPRCTWRNSACRISRSFDLTSLRTGMMSGAPCPIELMKRVLNEMHIRELVIAYGQTETSPVVTMSDAGDPLRFA